VFRLIPAPAHRAGLRIAHAIRLRWWRIRKPRFSGCRVLALDGAGRVLLVRHSYGSGHWMPPGGGMKRSEDALAAAARELFEETGCRLERAIQVSWVEEDIGGARNGVNIVVGHTSDEPCPDLREIIEASFFALHALPEDMAPQFRERLISWITEETAARRPDAAERRLPPAPTG
jgi:8-oxo-dGTP pyrophosphatase MutT (NUDIX family)